MRTTFRDRAPSFYSEVRPAVETRAKLDFPLHSLAQIVAIDESLFTLAWAKNVKLQKLDLLIRKAGKQGLSERRVAFRTALATRAPSQY